MHIVRSAASKITNGLEFDWTAGHPLGPQRAIRIALMVGILAGLGTWVFMSRPDAPSDFFHYWSATRTLLAGGNPYTVIAEGPANSWRDVALYPLTTMLLLIPFAWLPLAASGGAFIGVSSGLAATARFKVSSAWGICQSK